MRLVALITLGLVSLVTIVMTSGTSVVSLQGQVAREQLVIVSVDQSMRWVQPVPKLTFLSTEQQDISEQEALMQQQIDRFTRKPTDQDVVETGFGKMLVLGQGGQTVVVAHEVNGRTVVEEY